MNVARNARCTLLSRDCTIVNDFVFLGCSTGSAHIRRLYLTGQRTLHNKTYVHTAGIGKLFLELHAFSDALVNYNKYSRITLTPGHCYLDNIPPQLISYINNTSLDNIKSGNNHDKMCNA